MFYPCLHQVEVDDVDKGKLNAVEICNLCKELNSSLT